MSLAFDEYGRPFIILRVGRDSRSSGGGEFWRAGNLKEKTTTSSRLVFSSRATRHAAALPQVARACVY